MLHLLFSSLLLLTHFVYATKAPYPMGVYNPIATNNAQLPQVELPRAIVRELARAGQRQVQQEMNTQATVIMPNAETLLQTHLQLHNETLSPLATRFLATYANQTVNRTNFEDQFNIALMSMSRRFRSLGDEGSKIHATLRHVLSQN